jgi:Rrf2 family nitric oxide-sensitive transcriptional repressor
MPLISQTSEYALRAVVHLASRALNSNGKGSQTVVQIAAATQVPVGYLSKVLQQLTRADLIVSQRGIGGGFQLARVPGLITIYDVVDAVDEVPRIRSCPLGIADHEQLCPLHRKLDAAMAHAEAAFKSTTIADLVKSNPLRKSALCQIQTEV